ncbi:MAG TPA: hypothetical protein PKW82_03960 [Spirochaetales bacterium]|nr:hypothetical protein [Spirochaetales bacterium]
MSMFASVEDGEGETLGDVVELFEVYKAFPSGPDATGACLRFVGPEVDAAFNMRQFKYLREELEALRGAKLSATATAELEALLKLVKKAGEERRRTLRLYGDF